MKPTSESIKQMEGLAQRNQCDGCARGLPVEDGRHYGSDGLPVMCCTADRYAKREEGTPRTDTLIADGPFSGPKDWIQLWDKAIDSHRTLELALTERDALLWDIEAAWQIGWGKRDLYERIAEIRRHAGGEIMSDDTLDPQNEIDRQRDLALIRAGLEKSWRIMQEAQMEQCGVCCDNCNCQAMRRGLDRIRALSPESILEEWKGVK